jgi:hypothetical protein
MSTMNTDITKPPFRIGNRVRIIRRWARGLGDDGAETGTILAELGGAGGHSGLYKVLSDDGVLQGLAPEALELCSDCDREEGLQESIRRLEEQRENLFHDMLCIVAASRRANLADPVIRQQVAADVELMSSDWHSLASERMRRVEFSEKPELRTRFQRSLVAFLELGDLIEHVVELIDGDGEAEPLPGTPPA